MFWVSKISTFRELAADCQQTNTIDRVLDPVQSKFIQPGLSCKIRFPKFKFEHSKLKPDQINCGTVQAKLKLIYFASIQQAD